MSRPSHGPRPVKVQEWSDRLARFHASQMSVADFCRAESVSPASLYRWKKLLGKDPALRNTGTPDNTAADPAACLPQHHGQPSPTQGQPGPTSLTQAFTEVRLVDSPAATPSPAATTSPAATAVPRAAATPVPFGTAAPAATPARFATRSPSATSTAAVPPASGLRVRLPDGTRIAVRHDPATAALLIDKLFPADRPPMRQAAPADGDFPPLHHTTTREDRPC